MSTLLLYAVVESCWRIGRGERGLRVWGITLVFIVHAALQYVVHISRVRIQNDDDDEGFGLATKCQVSYEII